MTRPNSHEHSPQSDTDPIAQSPEDLQPFSDAIKAWSGFMDEMPRAIVKIREDMPMRGSTRVMDAKTEILPLFSQPEDQEVGDAMWVVRTGRHITVEVAAHEPEIGVYEYCREGNEVKKAWKSDGAITGIAPCSDTQGSATVSELKALSEKLLSASPTVA